MLWPPLQKKISSLSRSPNLIFWTILGWLSLIFYLQYVIQFWHFFYNIYLLFTNVTFSTLNKTLQSFALIYRRTSFLVLLLPILLSSVFSTQWHSLSECNFDHGLLYTDFSSALLFHLVCQVLCETNCMLPLPPHLFFLFILISPHWPYWANPTTFL